MSKNNKRNKSNQPSKKNRQPTLANKPSNETKKLQSPQFKDENNPEALELKAKKWKWPKWLTVALLVSLSALAITIWDKFIKQDKEEEIKLETGYINNLMDLQNVRVFFGPTMVKEYLNSLDSIERNVLLVKLDSIAKSSINNYYVEKHRELLEIWIELKDKSYYALHFTTYVYSRGKATHGLSQTDMGVGIALKDMAYRGFVNYLIDSFDVKCGNELAKEKKYKKGNN